MCGDLAAEPGHPRGRGVKELKGPRWNILAGQKQIDHGPFNYGTVRKHLLQSGGRFGGRKSLKACFLILLNAVFITIALNGWSVSRHGLMPLVSFPTGADAVFFAGAEPLTYAD